MDVSSSPWVAQLTFPIVVGLVLAGVPAWLGRKRVSSDQVQIGLLSDIRGDLQSSNTALDHARAECERERLSGQRWYQIACEWRELARELRHYAGNLSPAFSTEKDIPAILRPIPTLEGILEHSYER